MTDETRESLFRGYHGRVLLSITGGSLFISMVSMVVPPLLPTIIETFSISSTQAGLVMTVWWLAVSFFNAPGGRLANELSHKTGLIAGLLVAVVGVVLLTSSPVYLTFLLGVAIVGVGRGLYQPSAVGQIAALFVERRGQALGLRGAAFNFGGVVSGVLVAAVLAVGPWRTTFFPILVGLAVVLVSMHVWNREPYEIGRVKLDLRATLARLGRSRDVLLAVVALSLFGFMWNGAISFLPSFLQFGKGFSPTVASIAFSGVFVVGTVVQPVYGRFGDRRGHAFASCLAVGFCTAGLIGLLLAGNTVGILASLAVFAAGLSAFWPVMMAYGLQRLSEGTRTGDWGAITAIFLACEAVGSVYVGAVIDLTGYTVAFASLLVFLLASLLVTLGLAIAER